MKNVRVEEGGGESKFYTKHFPIGNFETLEMGHYFKHESFPCRNSRNFGRGAFSQPLRTTGPYFRRERFSRRNSRNFGRGRFSQPFRTTRAASRVGLKAAAEAAVTGKTADEEDATVTKLSRVEWPSESRP